MGLEIDWDTKVKDEIINNIEFAEDIVDDYFGKDAAILKQATGEISEAQTKRTLKRKDIVLKETLRMLNDITFRDLDEFKVPKDRVLRGGKTND